MADLSTALFSRWTSSAAITAVIGTRAYPNIRPQKSLLPAIRYQIISDPRTEHLKNYDAVQMARVQADCFGATYVEARALGELLITEMFAPASIEGIEFGHTKAEGPRDGGEDVDGTGFVHRAIVDLIIEYGFTS